MYDVIVVGARAAGAPTAMLLARKGYKVLLTDRTNFPSDTLSTHQVQVKGTAALKRWGLLDSVVASGCPPVRQATFNMQPYHIRGKFPPVDGSETMISPRRTVLDKILVDAAVDAGAELRENFIVEDLMMENGMVGGIRGRMKKDQNGSDTNMSEKARLVIGADGKHSLVARMAGAQEYKTTSSLTCAYYTYWEGLPLDEGGEIYSSPKGAIGLWPTNDGLTVIYTGHPVSEFDTIRQDIDGAFWKLLYSQPSLVDRARNGKQAERFYGTADLPGFYRRPYGPGWALAGDAGMTMDPISGQGIGNAFLDAERLADAIDAGFSEKKSLNEALAEYENKRNEETQPMYEFTAQTATFAQPSVEQQVLFAALEKDQEAANRFLGVLTGSVPIQEFFSLHSLLKIMGVSGMGRILLSKMTTQGRQNR